MFLKKIYLKGFKSFAYPVEINFTKGLTVVVGPNGSGKSNINDALRWVLGEASKKNLRASNAKDMIFAGSFDEKPAEYAEVTLFIDNSEGILNTKQKEVSITRKSYVNKDENEYYINKEPVKRKDIKDLFLDTGLGNVDLSIISQGSITKVIDAKPKDLRNLLNEAAGVSRYQKQKEESLRNLLSVERNIEMLTIKYEADEKRIKPLRKQAEKAKEYFAIRENLEKIELPIIRNELQKSKEALQAFQVELDNSTNLVNYSNEKISELSQRQVSNQHEILRIEKSVSRLQLKEKELKDVIEKQKLASKSDIENIRLQILEKQSSLDSINNKVAEFSKSESDLINKINSLKQQISSLNNERQRLNSEQNRIDFDIEQIQKNAKSKLDYGTQNIVNNQQIFSGYVGLVEELYTAKEKFSLAIKTAFGSQQKNIVMNNENSIKEALNFLKKNSYGTATFIPYEQVKPKNISEEFENILNNIKGYLGTVAENLEFNKKFFKLFNHLGGLTLIFDTFESALNASKIIDYRFKIITLEGDVIFPGFVVRGGSNQSKENYIQKQLSKLKEQFKEVGIKLKQNLSLYEESSSTLENFEKELSSLRFQEVRLQERVSHSEASLSSLLLLYKQSTGKAFEKSENSEKNSELQTFGSIEDINMEIQKNNSSKEIILKENIHFKEEEEKLRITWKEEVEKTTIFKNEIQKHNNVIMSSIKILQQDYKMNEEIFEAMEIVPLKIKYEEAEALRIKYRSEIEKIGYINFESIKEFEELDKSFQELTKELKDLKITKEKLISTISETDSKMEEKFSKVFDEINKEFEKAFIHLFNGGTARIKYSEPDNILESGIEIYARSPGKNVKNIQLYSGGEKSMIAIALIFSINKVRKLPLLILDEVEAALDEANVERFANFAKEINKKTQVIITSHRPGTMEKADILYGVTMQQKGITKILIVKLEDAINLAEE